MADDPVRASDQHDAVDVAVSAIQEILESDPVRAEALAEYAVTAMGRQPRLMRLHARSLRLQNRIAAANEIELDAIRASRHDPDLSEAARLLAAGQESAACAVLEKVLARDLDDPVANMMLGISLGSTGYFRRAEKLLRRAITAAPGYLEARTKLAGQLLLQCRPAEALKMIDSAIAMASPPAAILRLRATILAELGDYEGAASIYRGLLRADPREASDWISLGDTLRTVGNPIASEQAYRSALARNRSFGRSWWSLASLNDGAFGDDDIRSMESTVAATATTIDDDDNSMYIHFALATAYDQRGNHEAAFGHWVIGNRLCRNQRHYDPAIVTREIDRSKAALTSAYFDQNQARGNLSAAPIFIVGMPRSGSTLVEQILSSHPEVEGTAELPIIPILIQTWLSDRGAAPHVSYRDLLASLTAREAKSLGDEYIARANVYRKTEKSLFVDKLPHNWSDIGFIKAILPNAHIVDVRRSPLDCCFSNYKLMFAQGHPASYSLEEMALYYKNYVRFMDHIDIISPNYVHHVDYEMLVESIENETRRLLEYIGLEFDKRCLDFHSTKRAIATASSEQVRRPLNRSGIGSYKPYEKWLEPLKKALM